MKTASVGAERTSLPLAVSSVLSLKFCRRRPECCGPVSSCDRSRYEARELETNQLRRAARSLSAPESVCYTHAVQYTAVLD